MAHRACDVGRRFWLEMALASGVAMALGTRSSRAAPGASGRAPAPPPVAAPTPSPRGGASGAGPALRLALNENPFGPSPLALQALSGALTGLSRYTGIEAEQLVATIAARERVAVEQVILGDVLEPLGRHLARQGAPGGEIVYSSPGYTALVDAARLEGAVGAPVPLNERMENDLPALLARLGARTRALFLVNPHNPSGTVSSRQDFHAFVARAANVAPVIVDEAYIEYASDHAESSVVRHARPDGRVIVFRTFTKFYGLAALPLGYAIVPLDIGRSLREQGLGSARSQNRLAVVAARASLEDPVYAERVRRQVAEERARWFELLDALSLRRSQAAANFVFFHAGRPQPALAAAFAARGIDIGRAFAPLDDWARISIGLPEENARARRALREILSR